MNKNIKMLSASAGFNNCKYLNVIPVMTSKTEPYGTVVGYGSYYDVYLVHGVWGGASLAHANQTMSSKYIFKTPINLSGGRKHRFDFQYNGNSTYAVWTNIYVKAHFSDGSIKTIFTGTNRTLAQAYEVLSIRDFGLGKVLLALEITGSLTGTTASAASVNNAKFYVQDPSGKVTL